jgi:hypothetical protein
MSDMAGKAARVAVEAAGSSWDTNSLEAKTCSTILIYAKRALSIRNLKSPIKKSLLILWSGTPFGARSFARKRRNIAKEVNALLSSLVTDADRRYYQLPGRGDGAEVGSARAFLARRTLGEGGACWFESLAVASRPLQRLLAEMDFEFPFDFARIISRLWCIIGGRWNEGSAKEHARMELMGSAT